MEFVDLNYPGNYNPPRVAGEVNFDSYGILWGWPLVFKQNHGKFYFESSDYLHT
jgi:hypothetical protein